MATYRGPPLDVIETIPDLERVGDDDSMYDEDPSSDEEYRQQYGVKYKETNPVLKPKDKAWVSTQRHLAGAQRIVDVNPNRDIANEPKMKPVKITKENAYDESKLPKDLPKETIRYSGRHYARACFHQCARWQTHLFCEPDYIRAERQGIVDVCGTEARPVDSCAFCQQMTACDRHHRANELDRHRKNFEKNPNYKPSHKHMLPRDIRTNDIARIRTQALGQVWEETPWTNDEVKHRIKTGMSATAPVVTVDAACQTIELRIRKALDATDATRYIYIDQPCDKPIAWLKPLVTRFVKPEDADKLYGGMINWDDFVPADLLRNNAVTTVGLLTPANDGINIDETAMARTMEEISMENAKEKADFNNNIKVKPDPNVTTGPCLNILPVNKTYRRCTPYEIERHQKELERIAAEEKVEKTKDKNKPSLSTNSEPQPSTSTADPDEQPFQRLRQPQPIVARMFDPRPEEQENKEETDEIDEPEPKELEYMDIIAGAPAKEHRRYPICNMIIPHVNFNITTVNEPIMKEIANLPYDIKIRRVSDQLHPRFQHGPDEVRMPFITFPVHRDILSEISTVLLQLRIELNKQPDVWAVRDKCSSLSTGIDVGAILPCDSEIPVVAMDMLETVSVHTAKRFYIADEAGLSNGDICQLEEKLRAALLAHSHMANYDNIVDRMAADLPVSPETDRFLRVMHARHGVMMTLRRALVESLVNIVLWRRRQGIILTENLDKDYYIDLLVSPITSTVDLYTGEFGFVFMHALLTYLFFNTLIILRVVYVCDLLVCGVLSVAFYRSLYLRWRVYVL